MYKWKKSFPCVPRVWGALSVCTRMHVRGVRAAWHVNVLGFCQNEWNKWKNHFHEMKGDVGMSSHEKEREQETQRQKVTHP